MTDNAKYGNVKIRLPQDPGQAGKAQIQSYINFLAGFNVKALPVTGSKETRAEPVAAQWQAGNFDVIAADWNDEYFSQLESFPSSKFKDMVDATSDAFAELVQITERDKLVYPAFDSLTNIYCEDIADKTDTNKHRRYIAVEYSSIAPTVFLEILDDGNIVRVEGEYFRSDKVSVLENTENFVKFAGLPDSVIYVVLDEEAETFRNELRNRGYRLKSADNDVRNGIAKVSTMFSLNKLIINQSCKKLIEQLQIYIWDEKAAERGDEKPVKDNDTLCEALRKVISTVVYNKRRFSAGSVQ